MKERSDLDDICRSGDVALRPFHRFEQTFLERIRGHCKHNRNPRSLGTLLHAHRRQRSDCDNAVHLRIKEVLTDLINQCAVSISNFRVFFIVEPDPGLLSFHIQFPLDALCHSVPELVLGFLYDPYSIQIILFCTLLLGLRAGFLSTGTASA